MESNRPHIRIPDSSIFTSSVNKGAGGPTYKRVNYSAHGEKLLGDLAKFIQVSEVTIDENLIDEYFLQVKTPEGVNIKDFKTKLGNLGLGVISYSKKNPSAANVLIEKSDFKILQQKIETYKDSEKHIGKSNIAVIEEILPIPIDDKINFELDSQEDLNQKVSFTISLYTVLSLHEKEAILKSLMSFFGENGIQGLRTTYLESGQTLLSGNAPVSILKSVGEKYYTINSITPNGKVIATKSFQGQELPKNLKIEQPTSNVIVGVVDTGVDVSTDLFGPIVRYSQVILPHGTHNNFSHGSLVTSRILFGDNIESKIASLNLVPQCYIANIAMLGEDSDGDIVGHDEDTFVQILQSIIVENKDTIKIYNLSIGQESIADGFYSIFAKELDFISRKYDILFIVSAGNINDPQSPFPASFLHPNSRIQSPAESILSITAGSIANFSGSEMLSREKEISPFSCIGPGSDKGIKPEVISHGGNMDSAWSVNPRTAAYGLDASAKTLAYHVGTSFSAPIITNYCAKIYDKYEDATPNLAKAFLIHFAQPVLHPTLPGLSHEEFCGFGEPQINRILDGISAGAVYFFQGQVEKDTYQHIKFHIPNCLAAEAEGTKLNIKITVVYNPPINPDNEVEYSKCKMSLSVLKNTLGGLTEFAMDSNYNKAYSPILSFEKNFSRNYSSGEWQVRLRLTTKDNLPNNYKQDYALIIEINDSNGVGNVYDDVMREFAEIYGLSLIRKAA